MTNPDQTETGRVTRRRALKGVGGGIGLAALGAVGSGPAVADPDDTNGRSNQPWRHGKPQDWTQVYYDPSNRSRTPSEGPTDDIDVKWQQQVGRTMDWQPAVRDGTVYVGGRGDDFRALDAESGDELWSEEFDFSHVAGAPALYKDTVVVPMHTGEDAYHLRAFNAESGDSHKITDTNLPKSPKIYDGVIYLPLGGAVDAFDLDTGEKLWRGYTWGPVLDAPAYHPNGKNGTVYAGSWDYASGKSLTAFDAKTGDIKWIAETWPEGEPNGDGIQHAPVVYDGTVYVASHQDYLYAFDQDTGEELWSRKTHPEDVESDPTGSEALTRPPAVKNGILYYATYSIHRGFLGGHKYVEENSVYAMDLESREILWRNNTGHVNHGAPVIASETVYVISFDTVYAIDIANGDTRWTFEMSTKGYAGPAVVNGTVYVGDLNGNFYALAED